MKNEEKAKQIARGLTASDDYPYDYHSAFAGAMQAMQWKEQQLIDKACDFINQHFCITSNDHARSKEEYYNLTELTRDFINAMEEKGE